ncbi:MAG: hypothetical protein FJX61_14365 [Alphaproteobacteria bacterium]|nr:hypothetical protein [Alphaproteobacteria bacterium]
MTEIFGDEGPALPENRRSQSYPITEYDEHQENLRKKSNWSLKDVPFYRGKGKPQDPLAWHDFDYLDVYQKVYGRRCGSAGIGKLREVAIVVPGPDDEYSNHPYFHQDKEYMNRDGFFLLSDKLDIEKLKDEAAAFGAKFEENGVKVHWLRFPEKPMAAYGPMMNMHSAAELMVVPGGGIIGKKSYALSPTAGYGRTEYFARWALWNLGIPVLYTVTGEACWVMGNWLADDVFINGIGIEGDWRGLEQVAPVLKRACGEELQIISCVAPSWKYFDKHTGANTHAGMVVSGLDLNKVLVHTPGVDFNTLAWLKKNGYRIIEADLEEQIKHSAAAIVSLGPGIVMMHARARKTIAAVRKAGVEVVAIDYDEYNKYGAAITCATMLLDRDPGPRKFS